MLSNKIIKKRIIKIFSDGSINFCSTIVKRSKKVNFCNKDNKNFPLNQKDPKLINVKEIDFKLKYLR
jgi:hypothetical protein